MSCFCTELIDKDHTIMNNNNLLITDFDGSLVNRFDTDEAMCNLEVLGEVFDIVISTGREYGSMKKLIDRENFWKYVKYVVLANGCVVMSEVETTYIYLEKEEKDIIVQMSEELQLFGQGVEFYFSMLEKTVFIDSIEKANKNINASIFEIKIAIPAGEKQLLNWIINYVAFKELNVFVDLCTNETFYYMEVKGRHVNKFDSVKEYIGIEQYENVIALGDSINDINLFCFNATSKIYTTNEKIKIKGIEHIKDCKQLILDYGTDISSIYTNNKLLAFEKMVVKKFTDKKQYWAEKKVYYSLNSIYRPKLLGAIDEECELFIEKCSKPERLDYEKLIDMVNSFHFSTSKYGNTYELNGEAKYRCWEDYLLEQLDEWSVNVKKYIQNISEQIQWLKAYLFEKRTMNKKVSLIHRDIRVDNIGEINNRYVLYDYELSMWGDPIWDFSRMLYESKNEEDKEKIYLLSGYTKRDLNVYLCLYALSFLNYFCDADFKNVKEIEKCKRIILEFNYGI